VIGPAEAPQRANTLISLSPLKPQGRPWCGAAAAQTTRLYPPKALKDHTRRAPPTADATRV